MCLSSPKAPTPPPAAPAAPVAADPSKSPASGDRRRADAKRGASRSGTLLTGARGLVEPATTNTKTLLGG